MNEIIVIAIIAIPPIVIALLWWNNSIRENEAKLEIAKLEIKKEKTKIITPIQLSSYERLIAMLERFKIYGLLMRNNKSTIGSGQLQLALLNAIREEFEMNVTMQMYVGSQVWDQIIKGKDQTIDSVKKVGKKVGADASAMQFSQELLHEESEHDNIELQRGIAFLKHELKNRVLNV